MFFCFTWDQHCITPTPASFDKGLPLLPTSLLSECLTCQLIFPGSAPSFFYCRDSHGSPILIFPAPLLLASGWAIEAWFKTANSRAVVGFHGLFTVPACWPLLDNTRAGWCPGAPCALALGALAWMVGMCGSSPQTEPRAYCPATVPSLQQGLCCSISL